MTRYDEQLQKVWHQYEAQNGAVPSTSCEAVAWGVALGMIQVPEVDPLAKLAEDMATALREEYATDEQGRRYRVNHAVRVSKGGVQSTDVEAYNGFHKSESPIQTIFDFRDDIEERKPESRDRAA